MATGELQIIRDADLRRNRNDSRESGSRFKSQPPHAERQRSPAHPEAQKASEQPTGTRASHGSRNVERTERRARNNRPQPEERTSKRISPLAFGIGACVVAILGIGIIYLVFFSHVEITLNGKNTNVHHQTTYSDLFERGELTAVAGDLLAVDGTVLEVGAGEPPVVLVNGAVVTNLDETVKEGEVITDLQGQNVTEPVTVEERVIPKTTYLEAGSSFGFYDGTLHMALTPGQDGLEHTQTGTISGITMPPFMAQEMIPCMYGSYWPNFETGEKVVAFTYDDGPDPTYTQQILDVLEKHKVKATFFMLGTSAEKFPDTAKAVADSGHQVASHSYSHANNRFLHKLDANGVAYQISTAQDIIYEATGVQTRVFRPPGGNLNAAAALAGTPWVDAYVGWDISSGDFNKPGTEEIVDSVLSKVHSGSIVLMHDGGGDRTQTVEASDILIENLLADGYRFITIDELMTRTREAHGILPAKKGTL